MVAAEKTRSLKTLQEEWRELFRQMNDGEFQGNLTGPQLSVKPPGYDPDRIVSVLYVGIAPGKNEAQGDLPSAGDLRENASKFLKKEIKQKGSSAFWKFALKLSDELADRSRNPSQPLQNLVWSNICKIGVCNGNPGRRVFEAQKGLAVETLRAEIKTYRPQVVVWVTGDYRVEVIGQVINDPGERHWNKGLRAKWWLYQRRAMNSLPAMLWAYHPQGKKREMTAAWIDHACNLAQRKN